MPQCGGTSLLPVDNLNYTQTLQVQSAIKEVVGEGKLSQTLDASAAVALGATLLAPMPPPPTVVVDAAGADAAATSADPTTTTTTTTTATTADGDAGAACAGAGAGAGAGATEPSATASAARGLEEEMAAQDAVLVSIDTEKNTLETFIYETRRAGDDDSTHKSLFDAYSTLPSPWQPAPFSNQHDDSTLKSLFDAYGTLPSHWQPAPFRTHALVFRLMFGDSPAVLFGVHDVAGVEARSYMCSFSMPLRCSFSMPLRCVPSLMDVTIN
jgi:hypothetical protein